jgi:predicted 3-demethylubiquinone-9 3-methyltransferase (glyoxalase superfamily)
MGKLMANIQSSIITPCLWYNTNAEEAANFYTGIFKNSTINQITHYGKDMPLPEGTVLTVSFELDGFEFIALNAGPVFHFNEAVSFVVNCQNQEEIDYFWEKLSDGGELQVCGWLKDKFGLSWQVTPAIMNKWITSENPEKASRVMQALNEMVKIDIETLLKAYNG